MASKSCATLINESILSQAAWSHRSHKNFKMVWYEDIVRDRLGVIRDLSAFTGFELPEQKVEELSDMLRVDNFRRHHAEGAGDDEFNRGRMEKFVRKAEGRNGKRVPRTHL